MATNHTEHFNLSQWEPTDAFCRTDFNEDFLKIDAALAAQDTALAALARVEQLMYIPSHSGGMSTSATTPANVHWGEWEFICFLAEMPKDEEITPGELNISLVGGGGIVATIPKGSFLMLFCPRHDPTQEIHGLILCEKPVFFSSSLTYQEMQGIGMNPTNQGSPFPSQYVFGIR